VATLPDTSAVGQLPGCSSDCIALLDSALRVEQCYELFDRDASLADQRSQSALRDFPVIRNCEPSKRRLAMSQNDVAALLAVDLVTQPAKGSHRFAPGDPRYAAHTATSMTSS